MLNWEVINIKSVLSYRSNPRLAKKDRTKVYLDMPIEEYSAFRKQVQAHHLLRDRRIDDVKSDDNGPGHRTTQEPHQKGSPGAR